MKSADTRPAGSARPAAARRGGAEKQDFPTRLRRDMLRTWAASTLYRYTLIRPTPADLVARVGERWPGEAKRGEALLVGTIELCGETVRNPAPVWFPRAAGDEWLAAWHGFAWLPDLMSVGANARDAARALVQSWLRENTRWHPIAWRSDVLATRLFAWIVHLDEIAGRETDRTLRRAMLASLAMQLRHLGRSAGWEVSGAARLRALKGLVGGLAAFGGQEKRLQRALRLFESELPAQILADGGHRARSPSVQLDVLRDLIEVRAALRAAQRPVPGALQDALERMAPMLRFFRHGDRRLALFNDAVEEDGVLVDLVLTRSEAKGRAPNQAPHTGF